MLKDPILEEIYETRDAYAKQFGYDTKKIFADLRRRGLKSRARGVVFVDPEALAAESDADARRESRSPTLDELRAVRENIANIYGYDIHMIGTYFRQLDQADRRSAATKPAPRNAAKSRKSQTRKAATATRSIAQKTSNPTSMSRPKSSRTAPKRA